MCLEMNAEGVEHIVHDLSVPVIMRNRTFVKMCRTVWPSDGTMGNKCGTFSAHTNQYTTLCACANITLHFVCMSYSTQLADPVLNSKRLSYLTPDGILRFVHMPTSTRLFGSMLSRAWLSGSCRTASGLLCSCHTMPSQGALGRDRHQQHATVSILCPTFCHQHTRSYAKRKR